MSLRLAPAAARLGLERPGDGASLRCPAHDDRNASLSATLAYDGKVLLRCHAGCATGDAVAALGLSWGNLFPAGSRGRTGQRAAQRVPLSQIAAPDDGLAVLGEKLDRFLVAKLAATRGWDPDLLLKLGCKGVSRRGVRVRFPFIRGGKTVYWQDRLIEDGEPRWIGPPGTVPCPYEADRILAARESGHVWVVEGVSDAIALLHAMPTAAVLGIPGAAAFKRQWAGAFSGLTVWAIADADAGGQRLRRALDAALRDRAEAIHHVLVPAPHGDVDAWRRTAGAEFREQLNGAVLRAAERAGAANR